MPVIRTPDIRTFGCMNHLLESGSLIYCLFYSGYKNTSAIRTYFPTPKAILITGIHCIRIQLKWGMCDISYQLQIYAIRIQL